MKKIMFNDKYGLTQAVLEGRKTMTRRIVPDGTPIGNWNETVRHALYKIGEVVAISQSYKECGYDGEAKSGWCHDENEQHVDIHFKEEAGWTNKMFVRSDLMKHHIRITDIKVERLQDISKEDCKKEGIDYVGGYSESYYFGHGVGNNKFGNSHREAFAALIDKVSGKGTWESNPWVFCYSFELVD